MRMYFNFLSLYYESSPSLDKFCVCDFDVNALLARRVCDCDEEVGG